MLNKRILLTVWSLSLAYVSFSQDVIIRNNGTREKAKIKEVGPKTVTYKRWDNLDGPNFILPKGEIRSIRYENGEEDVFKGARKRGTGDSPVLYGKNILAIAPMWMTNTGPIGFGISYERFVDKRNVLSLILPLAYSINNGNNYGYNYSNGNNRRSRMLWAYPGVKIYLGSKNEGKASYALGVSAILGSGNIEEDAYFYDPATQTQQYMTVKNSILLSGVMLNNSFNFQPSKNIYFGLELGLGLPYLVEEHLDNNWQSNYSMSIPYATDMPLVNFNFKIGYRF